MEHMAIILEAYRYRHIDRYAGIKVYRDVNTYIFIYKDMDT